MYTIEIIVYSDTQDRSKLKITCFDYLVRKWRPGGGGGGVGCHFSPSWSNTKNKNKSSMLIPILFPEVMHCDRFYFVHCIQFSQLNDYTSSKVTLKS